MKYTVFVFRSFGLAALLTVSHPASARIVFRAACLPAQVASAPVASPFRGASERVGEPASQDRSAELLRALAERMRALERYAVAFSVEADGHSAAGSYTVGGDRYYLRLADAEVYGDGKARYEVDNRRKEVAVDHADAASRNILDNPAQAFDLLEEGFLPELLREWERYAAVRLMPREGQAVSAVTVTIDTQTLLPVALEYDFDGERIRIAIRSIEAVDKAPKEYDPAEYRTYETIDFR